MRRIGDLLPEAAAALGLEPELRRARLVATWERVVAEHVPAASGTRVVELDEASGRLVVGAGSPAIAQELNLRLDELLEALGCAPGVGNLRELRVVVRADGRTTGGRPAAWPDVD